MAGKGNRPSKKALGQTQRGPGKNGSGGNLASLAIAASGALAVLAAESDEQSDSNRAITAAAALPERLTHFDVGPIAVAAAQLVSVFSSVLSGSWINGSAAVVVELEQSKTNELYELPASSSPVSVSLGDIGASPFIAAKPSGAGALSFAGALPTARSSDVDGKSSPSATAKTKPSAEDTRAGDNPDDSAPEDWFAEFDVSIDPGFVEAEPIYAINAVSDEFVAAFDEAYDSGLFVPPILAGGGGGGGALAGGGAAGGGGFAGRVFDGPISGLRVFVDANGDGEWQAGEQVTYTDSYGAYSFSGEVATDASIVAGTYTLYDRAFVDANNDGVWNEGETFTYTDSQGNYEFDETLADGTAVLLEAAPNSGTLVLGYDELQQIDMQVSFESSGANPYVSPLTTAIAGASEEKAAEILAVFGVSGSQIAADPFQVVGGEIGLSANAAAAEVVKAGTALLTMAKQAADVAAQFDTTSTFEDSLSAILGSFKNSSTAELSSLASDTEGDFTAGLVGLTQKALATKSITITASQASDLTDLMGAAYQAVKAVKSIDVSAAGGLANIQNVAGAVSEQAKLSLSASIAKIKAAPGGLSDADKAELKSAVSLLNASDLVGLAANRATRASFENSESLFIDAPMSGSTTVKNYETLDVLANDVKAGEAEQTFEIIDAFAYSNAAFRASITFTDRVKVDGVGPDLYSGSVSGFTPTGEKISDVAADRLAYHVLGEFQRIELSGDIPVGTLVVGGVEISVDPDSIATLEELAESIADALVADSPTMFVKHPVDEYVYKRVLDVSQDSEGNWGVDVYISVQEGNLATVKVDTSGLEPINEDSISFNAEVTSTRSAFKSLGERQVITLDLGEPDLVITLQEFPEGGLEEGASIKLGDATVTLDSATDMASLLALLKESIPAPIDVSSEVKDDGTGTLTLANLPDGGAAELLKADASNVGIGVSIARKYIPDDGLAEGTSIDIGGTAVDVSGALTMAAILDKVKAAYEAEHDPFMTGQSVSTSVLNGGSGTISITFNSFAENPDQITVTGADGLTLDISTVRDQAWRELLMVRTGDVDFGERHSVELNPNDFPLAQDVTVTIAGQEILFRQGLDLDGALVALEEGIANLTEAQSPLVERSDMADGTVKLILNYPVGYDAPNPDWGGLQVGGDGVEGDVEIDVGADALTWARLNFDPSAFTDNVFSQTIVDMNAVVNGNVASLFGKFVVYDLNSMRAGAAIDGVTVLSPQDDTNPASADYLQISIDPAKYEDAFSQQFSVLYLVDDGSDIPVQSIATVNVRPEKPVFQFLNSSGEAITSIELTETLDLADPLKNPLALDISTSTDGVGGMGTNGSLVVSGLPAGSTLYLGDGEVTSSGGVWTITGTENIFSDFSDPTSGLSYTLDDNYFGEFTITVKAENRFATLAASDLKTLKVVVASTVDSFAPISADDGLVTGPPDFVIDDPLVERATPLDADAPKIIKIFNKGEDSDVANVDLVNFFGNASIKSYDPGQGLIIKLTGIEESKPSNVQSLLDAESPLDIGAEWQKGEGYTYSLRVDDAFNDSGFIADAEGLSAAIAEIGITPALNASGTMQWELQLGTYEVKGDPEEIAWLSKLNDQDSQEPYVLSDTLVIEPAAGLPTAQVTMVKWDSGDVLKSGDYVRDDGAEQTARFTFEMASADSDEILSLAVRAVNGPPFTVIDERTNLTVVEEAGVYTDAAGDTWTFYTFLSGGQAVREGEFQIKAERDSRLGLLDLQVAVVSREGSIQTTDGEYSIELAQVTASEPQLVNSSVNLVPNSVPFFYPAQLATVSKLLGSLVEDEPTPLSELMFLAGRDPAALKIYINKVFTNDAGTSIDLTVSADEVGVVSQTTLTGAQAGSYWVVDLSKTGQVGDAEVDLSTIKIIAGDNNYQGQVHLAGWIQDSVLEPYSDGVVDSKWTQIGTEASPFKYSVSPRVDGFELVAPERYTASALNAPEGDGNWRVEQTVDLSKIFRDDAGSPVVKQLDPAETFSGTLVFATEASAIGTFSLVSLDPTKYVGHPVYFSNPTGSSGRVALTEADIDGLLVGGLSLTFKPSGAAVGITEVSLVLSSTNGGDKKQNTFEFALTVSDDPLKPNASVPDAVGSEDLATPLGIEVKESSSRSGFESKGLQINLTEVALTTNLGGDEASDAKQYIWFAAKDTAGNDLTPFGYDSDSDHWNVFDESGDGVDLSTVKMFFGAGADGLTPVPNVSGKFSFTFVPYAVANGKSTLDGLTAQKYDDLKETFSILVEPVAEEVTFTQGQYELSIQEVQQGYEYKALNLQEKIDFEALGAIADDDEVLVIEFSGIPDGLAIVQKDASGNYIALPKTKAPGAETGSSVIYLPMADAKVDLAAYELRVKADVSGSKTIDLTAYGMEPSNGAITDPGAVQTSTLTVQLAGSARTPAAPLSLSTTAAVISEHAVAVGSEALDTLTAQSYVKVSDRVRLVSETAKDPSETLEVIVQNNAKLKYFILDEGVLDEATPDGISGDFQLTVAEFKNLYVTAPQYASYATSQTFTVKTQLTDSDYVEGVSFAETQSEQSGETTVQVSVKPIASGVNSDITHVEGNVTVHPTVVAVEDQLGQKSLADFFSAPELLSSYLNDSSESLWLRVDFDGTKVRLVGTNGASTPVVQSAAEGSVLPNYVVVNAANVGNVVLSTPKNAVDDLDFSIQAYSMEVDGTKSEMTAVGDVTVQITPVIDFVQSDLRAPAEVAARLFALGDRASIPVTLNFSDKGELTDPGTSVTLTLTAGGRDLIVGGEQQVSIYIGGVKQTLQSNESSSALSLTIAGETNSALIQKLALLKLDSLADFRGAEALKLNVKVTVDQSNDHSGADEAVTYSKDSVIEIYKPVVAPQITVSYLQDNGSDVTVFNETGKLFIKLTGVDKLPMAARVDQLDNTSILVSNVPPNAYFLDAHPSSGGANAIGAYLGDGLWLLSASELFTSDTTDASTVPLFIVNNGEASGTLKFQTSVFDPVGGSSATMVGDAFEVPVVFSDTAQVPDAIYDPVVFNIDISDISAPSGGVWAPVYTTPDDGAIDWVSNFPDTADYGVYLAFPDAETVPVGLEDIGLRESFYFSSPEALTDHADTGADVFGWVDADSDWLISEDELTLLTYSSGVFSGVFSETTQDLTTHSALTDRELNPLAIPPSVVIVGGTGVVEDGAIPPQITLSSTGGDLLPNARAFLKVFVETPDDVDAAVGLNIGSLTQGTDEKYFWLIEVTREFVEGTESLSVETVLPEHFSGKISFHSSLLFSYVDLNKKLPFITQGAVGTPVEIDVAPVQDTPNLFAADNPFVDSYKEGESISLSNLAQMTTPDENEKDGLQILLRLADPEGYLGASEAEIASDGPVVFNITGIDAPDGGVLASVYTGSGDTGPDLVTDFPDTAKYGVYLAFPDAETVPVAEEDINLSNSYYFTTQAQLIAHADTGADVFGWIDADSDWLISDDELTPLTFSNEEFSGVFSDTTKVLTTHVSKQAIYDDVLDGWLVPYVNLGDYHVDLVDNFFSGDLRLEVSGLVEDAAGNQKFAAESIEQFLSIKPISDDVVAPTLTTSSSTLAEGETAVFSIAYKLEDVSEFASGTLRFELKDELGNIVQDVTDELGEIIQVADAHILDVTYDSNVVEVFQNDDGDWEWRSLEAGSRDDLSAIDIGVIVSEGFDGTVSGSLTKIVSTESGAVENLFTPNTVAPVSVEILPDLPRASQVNYEFILDDGTSDVIVGDVLQLTEGESYTLSIASIQYEEYDHSLSIDVDSLKFTSGGVDVTGYFEIVFTGDEDASDYQWSLSAKASNADSVEPTEISLDVKLVDKGSDALDDRETILPFSYSVELLQVADNPIFDPDETLGQVLVADGSVAELVLPSVVVNLGDVDWQSDDDLYLQARGDVFDQGFQLVFGSTLNGFEVLDIEGISSFIDADEKRTYELDVSRLLESLNAQNIDLVGDDKDDYSFGLVATRSFTTETINTKISWSAYAVEMDESEPIVSVASDFVTQDISVTPVLDSPAITLPGIVNFDQGYTSISLFKSPELIALKTGGFDLSSVDPSKVYVEVDVTLNDSRYQLVEGSGAWQIQQGDSTGADKQTLTFDEFVNLKIKPTDTSYDVTSEAEDPVIFTITPRLVANDISSTDGVTRSVSFTVNQMPGEAVTSYLQGGTLVLGEAAAISESVDIGSDWIFASKDLSGAAEFTGLNYQTEGMLVYVDLSSQLELYSSSSENAVKLSGTAIADSDLIRYQFDTSQNSDNFEQIFIDSTSGLKVEETAANSISAYSMKDLYVIAPGGVFGVDYAINASASIVTAADGKVGKVSATDGGLINVKPTLDAPLVVYSAATETVDGAFEFSRLELLDGVSYFAPIFVQATTAPGEYVDVEISLDSDDSDYLTALGLTYQIQYLDASNAWVDYNGAFNGGIDRDGPVNHQFRLGILNDEDTAIPSHQVLPASDYASDIDSDIDTAALIDDSLDLTVVFRPQFGSGDAATLEERENKSVTTQVSLVITNRNDAPLAWQPNDPGVEDSYTIKISEPDIDNPIATDSTGIFYRDPDPDENFLSSDYVEVGPGEFYGHLYLGETYGEGAIPKDPEYSVYEMPVSINFTDEEAIQVQGLWVTEAPHIQTYDVVIRDSQGAGTESVRVTVEITGLNDTIEFDAQASQVVQVTSADQVISYASGWQTLYGGGGVASAVEFSKVLEFFEHDLAQSTSDYDVSLGVITASQDSAVNRFFEDYDSALGIDLIHINEDKLDKAVDANLGKITLDFDALTDHISFLLPGEVLSFKYTLTVEESFNPTGLPDDVVTLSSIDLAYEAVVSDANTQSYIEQVTVVLPRLSDLLTDSAYQSQLFGGNIFDSLTKERFVGYKDDGTPDYEDQQLFMGPDDVLVFDMTVTDSDDLPFVDVVIPGWSLVRPEISSDRDDFFGSEGRDFVQFDNTAVNGGGLIFGNAGHDVILAGGGRDLIILSPGVDYVSGGDGRDAILIASDFADNKSSSFLYDEAKIADDFISLCQEVGVGSDYQALAEAFSAVVGASGGGSVYVAGYVDLTAGSSYAVGGGPTKEADDLIFTGFEENYSVEKIDESHSLIYAKTTGGDTAVVILQLESESDYEVLFVDGATGRTAEDSIGSQNLIDSPVSNGYISDEGKFVVNHLEDTNVASDMSVLSLSLETEQNDPLLST